MMCKHQQPRRRPLGIGGHPEQRQREVIRENRGMIDPGVGVIQGFQREEGEPVKDGDSKGELECFGH